MVDLTAVAAFTAAGLSLVNVAISARLASSGHREQWRRDEERPIVARCITLSADARQAWWDTSYATQYMAEGAAWDGSDAERYFGKGIRLIQDLRYEVAQLDLLASPAVREAARFDADGISAEHRASTQTCLDGPMAARRRTYASSGEFVPVFDWY